VIQSYLDNRIVEGVVMNQCVGRLLRHLVIGAAVAFSFPEAAGSQVPATQLSGGDSIVAVGDGFEIHLSELDVASEQRLRAVRSQEYSIKRAVLIELINKRVLARAAQQYGVTVDELVAAEVAPKRATASPTVRAMHGEFVPSPPSVARNDVLETDRSVAASSQEVVARTLEYLRVLRDGMNVRVLLEPPRFRVNIGSAPAMGSETAAVTLVVFSDFQCPFCGKMAPVVRRIQHQYGNNVRLVFKNFPLPGHAAAPKAAEAALCAGEQRRFWEMHDTLFKDQGRLDIRNLANYAHTAGIDVEAFTACVESGLYAVAVRRDVIEGNSYGVSATPTTFLNGQPLVGVMSFESLSEAINFELRRLGLSETVRPSESR
jgi:protein-disulfide isomerase